MAPKIESRYILFTGEVHETVKFDFTINQIGTFIGGLLGKRKVVS